MLSTPIKKLTYTADLDKAAKK